jgi:hypothetical protein
LPMSIEERPFRVFHGIPELGYADACLPGKL